MPTPEEFRAAGLALHRRERRRRRREHATAGEVVRRSVAVEVLNVTLEAALRTRRVVALRARVLKVCVHVRVEVVLGVA